MDTLISFDSVGRMCSFTALAHMHTCTRAEVTLVDTYPSRPSSSFLTIFLVYFFLAFLPLFIVISTVGQGESNGQGEFHGSVR